MRGVTGGRLAQTGECRRGRTKLVVKVELVGLSLLLTGMFGDGGGHTRSGVVTVSKKL